MPDPVKVLMVCLGNICRSPTAQAVLSAQVRHRGLHEMVLVDSAGTGDWHVGEPPDRRAIRHAAQRNYDLTPLRARQVTPDDFECFDYILAMDRQNLADLRHLSPPRHRNKIDLFLRYGNGAYDEVPDPYYSGERGFNLVLDLVEETAENLLRHLIQEHRLDAGRT